MVRQRKILPGKLEQPLTGPRPCLHLGHLLETARLLAVALRPIACGPGNALAVPDCCFPRHYTHPRSPSVGMCDLRCCPCWRTVSAGFINHPQEVNSVFHSPGCFAARLADPVLIDLAG
jgi:hypothetical protein